jgi:hypothetical protein
MGLCSPQEAVAFFVKKFIDFYGAGNFIPLLKAVLFTGPFGQQAE